MIDTYDEWNPFNPINQKEVEMYTEEQILLDQLDTMERRFEEKVKHCLHLQRQLKRLAELHRIESTFGSLTYEEQKEKLIILSIYETI
jgi:hypothetical protein